MSNNGKIVHKPAHWLRGFFYYLRCKIKGKPPLVNIEFTKKCNAKCGFCQYWQLDSPNELSDYSPILKVFKPVTLSISGGEPLMRKDCIELIQGVRPHAHYISIITNGALLNEDKARSLVRAGVDHISVSLDYLSEKHDEVRGIKDLYKHISNTVPSLSSAGYRLSLNTIIMESNLDQILPIAYKAKEWGVSVSYSAFCMLKIDNDDEMVRKKRLGMLNETISELIKLKRKLKNIRNSDFYLKKVPDYFRDGYIRNCRAGDKWIHVTPDGYIQPCSDLPRICHYKEYNKKDLHPIACNKCWYTCRGEAEACPFAPRRFYELMKS